MKEKPATRNPSLKSANDHYRPRSMMAGGNFCERTFVPLVVICFLATLTWVCFF